MKCLYQDCFQDSTGGERTLSSLRLIVFEERELGMPSKIDPATIDKAHAHMRKLQMELRVLGNNLLPSPKQGQILNELVSCTSTLDDIWSLRARKIISYASGMATSLQRDDKEFLARLLPEEIEVLNTLTAALCGHRLMFVSEYEKEQKKEGNEEPCETLPAT